MPQQSKFDEIFDQFQIQLPDAAVKIFDESNIELHKIIAEQCKREYSTENWEFLQKIKDLHTTATPDPVSLINLFKHYIEAGSPSELNINSSSRAELQNKFFNYEEKQQPLVLDDFADAVKEITKLMMGDTFNRIRNNSNLTTAHKLDLIESKNQDNKLSQELSAVELYKDITKYALTNLHEIHIDKPLFQFGRKSFEEAPFKSSQQIIEMIKIQLSELLHHAEKYTLSEFAQKYESIINKNEKVLAKYAEVIDKQIRQMPVADEMKMIYQQQLTKLNNVISTAKLDFSWNPQELANAKRVGVSNMIDSFTSSPIVEISETEVASRSRSASFSSRNSN